MSSSTQEFNTTSTPSDIIITPSPLEEVDTLIGGEGADVFFLKNNRNQLAPLSPAANVIGTNDPETLVGTADRDVILGRTGDDMIIAFTGDDFLNGQIGNDMIFSGQGNDTAIGELGLDTIFGDTGIDLVQGGLLPDLLFGNQDNDTLYGDLDDDSLYGGQGNDSLIGGTGNDLVVGDRGNDTLLGISGSIAGYTLITDFDENEDSILLPGNSDLYRLDNAPFPFTDSTAIYQLNLGTNTEQLIAIVEGASNLNLEDDYFSFS